VSPATTPSQTVGPFFAVALPWSDGPHVVPDGTAGAIRIGGRVLDGAGAPVPDALIETWQADPEGRFDHPEDPRGRFPGFRGFGRCPTDDAGRWAVVTLKPGPVPAPDGGEQAPHIAVSILARGLLNRVVTRIYFGDEAEANAADPVLAALADPDRATLIAAPVDGGYAIDFRLQGDGETVFFGI
jgi:protocatechuate 3,4-dioxygenase, alpha subunit